MKHCIFPLLLLVLLLGVNKTHAQAQHDDPAIIAGHFNMDTLIGSATNHINVNYILYSKPFNTSMNVELNTPAATLFNVDFLDAGNTVLATWTPSTLSNSYNHSMDISSLAPGSYHVNIRKNYTSAILKTIAFTK